MTFDSLTYARRLRSAGFTEAKAEALADANRETVMQDIATKGDIAVLKGEIAAVKDDVAALKAEITPRGRNFETGIEATMKKQRLEFTVNLGVILAAELTIFAIINMSP